MGWIYAELVAVALAAMMSPTTLSFSILALVLGKRPLRTGIFFYLGALGVTLLIGVVAAFVLQDVAADDKPSTPKTWVAVVDIVLAIVIVVYILRALRRPPNRERQGQMMAQMSKVASSPAIAVVAAGATLANPGAFIPIALKDISEMDPSHAEYIVNWVFFAVVSLLPLLVAIILLLVAPKRATRILEGARSWLDRHIRAVAGVLLVLVAAVLLRNGIAGLIG